MPQRIADYEDLADSGRVVLGTEQTPELRANAEHVEVRRAREQRLDALRLIDLREVRVDCPYAGDGVEETAAIAIIDQFGLREAHVGRVQTIEVRGDAHEE